MTPLHLNAIRVSNHLVADHGSIFPFCAGPCEVGDPDMGAPLGDDNLGDLSRGTGAEEREDEDRGKGFHREFPVVVLSASHASTR